LRIVCLNYKNEGLVGDVSVNYFNASVYMSMLPRHPELKGIRMPVLYMMANLIEGPKPVILLSLEADLGHKTARSITTRKLLVERGFIEEKYGAHPSRNEVITHYKLSRKWVRLMAKLFTVERPQENFLVIDINAYRKNYLAFPKLRRLAMSSLIMMNHVRSKYHDIPNMIREDKYLFMPALGGARDALHEKGLVKIETKKRKSPPKGACKDAQHIKLSPLGRKILAGVFLQPVSVLDPVQ
jgi:hypothetical protein